ncbi:MAG: GntR family transcriptional regulator [Longimicrobiales bacterium]
MDRTELMLKEREGLQTERGDRIVHAYGTLRELIVCGRLSPGSRIIETEVASRLGVSRTPVRAALQRLQQEGFVLAHGGGVQMRMSVAPLTEPDARELFAIMAQIEALASRRAAELGADARADLVDRLRWLNGDLVSAADRPDADARMFALDQAFHRAVLEAAAGPRVALLHDSFKPQIERYGRSYPQAYAQDVADTTAEYDVLIDAIEAGVPDMADVAMRRNWHNASERLCRLIRTTGERGTW